MDLKKSFLGIFALFHILMPVAVPCAVAESQLPTLIHNIIIASMGLITIIFLVFNHNKRLFKSSLIAGAISIFLYTTSSLGECFYSMRWNVPNDPMSLHLFLGSLNFLAAMFILQMIFNEGK